MSHKKTVPIGINQRANDRFLSDISQTPGGTIWGTTPGGTRIKYDKDTLMKYSLSPLAKTPPINLPFIPGVTKSFERPSPLASYEEEKKTEETTETKKPKIEANEEMMFGEMEDVDIDEK